MPESDEPDEEILKIAKAGVLGMTGAIGEKPVPPDVMIEAALHVFAAWKASGHTGMSTDESDERVDELIETLPSYIGYHRAAGWIPEPSRGDH